MVAWFSWSMEWYQDIEMGRCTKWAIILQLMRVGPYWHSIASSLKLLLIPILLWANWELLAPYVAKGIPNPFAPLLFISHKVPTSSPDDPRYQKGYLDLVFIAYYIIFWSFFRQSVTIYLCRPFAKSFGIKKEGKLDRFGEQAYAVIYFSITGLWGLVSISHYGMLLCIDVTTSESCPNCPPGGTKRSTSGLVRCTGVYLVSVRLNNYI